MRRRVVVTGASMITPLGVGMEKSWDGLVEGRSGTSRLTRLDATRFGSRAAGEVRDFDPRAWIDSSRLRYMGRYTQFAVAGARLAWINAGLALSEEEAFRAGCILGNAVGGLPEIETGKELLLQGELAPSRPLFPRILANQAPGQVAIDLGLRGPVGCVATACASGNNAIGSAMRLIREGDADIIVTGSTESCLSEICYADLERIGLLSKEEVRFEAACRPFDRDRSGLVPAEGVGILVLEEEGRARQRRAHVYCEVLGYGNSCDAFHPLVPRKDASGVRQCIEHALRDACTPPERVGYVNAHGVGTQLGDEVETLGIELALGEHARRTPISSTKSMLGHMFGGSGGVEAVVAALVVDRGVIPPTINYETPDVACNLDYVPNAAREARVDVSISNAFGFGGTNATIVLGRYEGGVS